MGIPSRVSCGAAQWKLTLTLKKTTLSYDTARKIKDKQDGYCRSTLAGQWQGLGEYPEDLQWEALVDVLRGRVKVHNHCYEAVDLDDMVRVSAKLSFLYSTKIYLVDERVQILDNGIPPCS